MSDKTGDASDALKAAIHSFLSNQSQGREDYLNEVSRNVLSTARSKKLPANVVGLPEEETVSAETMTREIESALIEFILEKEAVQKAILCPDTPNPERFLRTSFIRYWIDRVRRAGSDPRRNLRDYVMRVIREDDRFYRYTHGKEVLYSLCERNRTLQPLSDEDLIGISFPEGLVGNRSMKGIKKIAVMPRLAGHFWRKVVEMYETPCAWVPLNSLVRWLLIHTASADDRPVFIDSEAMGNELPDEENRPDRLYFDSARVRGFAEKFSARLEKRHKPSFFLHYCLSMTPREMAETIGYTDETARHHIEEIDGMLRTFLSDLPWVSPPDLNHRAFTFFLKILCDILETTVSSA
jgi:DNA-directed RNA polymerase specialized sigma24 family protein